MVEKGILVNVGQNTLFYAQTGAVNSTTLWILGEKTKIFNFIVNPFGLKF